MLRDDVVAACSEGRFSVWEVRTIDDALELLTGLPAATVDERVVAGLDALDERAVAFAARALAGAGNGHAAARRRSRSAT
jgi:hypothetical protein